eukprot:2518198-Rhodomonas_salina.1
MMLFTAHNPTRHGVGPSLSHRGSDAVQPGARILHKRHRICARGSGVETWVACARFRKFNGLRQQKTGGSSSMASLAAAASRSSASCLPSAATRSTPTATAPLSICMICAATTVSSSMVRMNCAMISRNGRVESKPAQGAGRGPGS